MGRKILILATHGFEESELRAPKEYLEGKGHEVAIVSTAPDAIKAWANGDWGKEYEVDKIIDEIRVSEWDALVLPGGVINPDKLRMNMSAIQLIRDFDEQGKIIAAICHGPQLLIEAGLVQGRQLTSVENIKTDLVNAGASWENNEVILDGNLVTSRTPMDLPAFNQHIEQLLNDLD